MEREQGELDVEERRAPSGRILLVGDYPPPWGGIAVHVRSLLELGLREGLDARVLDVGRGRRGRRLPRVNSAGGGAAFAAQLAAAARAGAVIHAHVSGNNGKAWLVALAAGRARRPGGPGAVLTVHSGLAPVYLAAGAARRQLARLACSGYTRILCANRGIARALGEAGVPAEKLEALPAFVDRGRVPEEAPPEEARAARRRFDPLLAAALAPGVQYGTDVLLAALPAIGSRFPKAGLLAFGPGTGAPAFRALLASHGLEGRAIGLGELGHSAALAVMRLADLFVRPTRADGDSISVREALGLGVRVVASDVGHRPAGTVKFRSGEPGALAAAVAASLAGPPPRGAIDGDSSRRILDLWQRLAHPGAEVPGREGAEA